MTGSLGKAIVSSRIIRWYDSALGVGVRAQRRSIVEIGASIPRAVPSVALEGLSQLRGVLPPICAADLFTAAICQRRESRERSMKKPAEPYAFAFTTCSHAVHPVVPISGSHQRQTVRADGETGFKRARTVLEERRLFAGNGWLRE